MVGVAVGFHADDARYAVANAERHTKHYFRNCAVHIQALVFGQFFHVFFVQKQGFVGPNGVFGEAVSQFPLRETYILFEIFVHVIGKIDVAFVGVIERDKKVSHVNYFAQLLVNALIKFV